VPPSTRSGFTPGTQAAAGALAGSLSAEDLNKDMSETGTVTVVVGRFEPLIGRGLMEVLCEDDRVDILGSELGCVELEHAVVARVPRVAVVDESAEPFVLARLRLLQPSTGVVVLAYSPSPEYGLRLLTCGATCLARSAPITDILSGIHLTAQGARVFASLDGHRVERRYPSNGSLLTPRETEVLRHISANRSNPEIAGELHISVETVSTHVTSIRRKLDAKSKRELVGIPIPTPPSLGI
jgi:DNA-binding NarL/FixJ family response regulator